MALTTRELAGIYTSKGWRIAGTHGENPSRSELLMVMGRLAAHLTEHGDASYSNTARLMAVKDEDFPDNVDFYLFIGTASPKIVDHETQGV
ncbi:hypothetical protein PSH03_005387 [Micromonospora sp. PSH03]|uniref:hypothetical protein n=1 Tax=Micromonospora salmantinae TaxID=2911211 RepID=UPI001EE8930B|nr:hypothetical protein [Micromonospora salmantinae]MCG5459604.1 hypothetical protein [Micromonospora salmantinae]